MSYFNLNYVQCIFHFWMKDYTCILDYVSEGYYKSINKISNSCSIFKNPNNMSNNNNNSEDNSNKSKSKVIIRLKYNAKDNNINKLNDKSNPNLITKIKKVKNRFILVNNNISNNLINNDKNNNCEFKHEEIDRNYWIILNKTKFDNENSRNIINTTNNTINTSNNNINAYKLHKYDIIKLGKQLFRIIKLVVNNSKKNNPRNSNILNYNNMRINTQSNNNIYEEAEDLSNNLIEEKENSIFSKISSNPVCKICFGEASSSAVIEEVPEEIFENNNTFNPLICPCKCTGSLRFLHLKCLKMWIKAKTVERNINPYVNMYTVKTSECEICKAYIPLCVRINNKIFELVEYTIPNNANNNVSSNNMNNNTDNTPYFILEQFPKDPNISNSPNQNNQNITCRIWYIVSFNSNTEDNNNINTHNSPIIERNIGRGNESDIKTNCISISRKHSNFIFHNNTFYLKDLESKFGTLVLLKESIPLICNREFSIQYNTTYSEFTMKQNCIGFIYGICSKENEMSKNYNDYLIKNSNYNRFKPKKLITYLDFSTKSRKISNNNNINLGYTTQSKMISKIISRSINNTNNEISINQESKSNNYNSNNSNKLDVSVSSEINRLMNNTINSMNRNNNLNYLISNNRNNIHNNQEEEINDMHCINIPEVKKKAEKD